MVRLLFDGYDVGALLGRMASLAIRFTVPLYVLATASAEELGSFYLFTSFLTFVVFLASFEMSTGFAKTYIQAADASQGALQVFYLGATQLSMATMLAVPLVIANRQFDSVPALVVVTIVSESLVNEVGRFCWNIGRTRLASIRDFARSVSFGCGVFLSIKVENNPIGPVFFCVVILANSALTVFDLRLFGVSKIFSDFLGFRQACRDVVKNAFQTLRGVSWQVAQMQILALIPLMERLALDRAGGMSLVAAYSFQYSLIQSGSTLLSMPHVSSFRVEALGAKRTPAMRTRELMVLLIARLSIVVVAAAMLTYMVVPIIATLLDKSIERSAAIIVAVVLSSLAGTFSAATSPSYTATQGFGRNLVSLLGCLPLFVMFLLPSRFNATSSGVLAAIGLTAAVHLASRFLFSAAPRSE